MTYHVIRLNKDVLKIIRTLFRPLLGRVNHIQITIINASFLLLPIICTFSIYLLIYFLNHNVFPFSVMALIFFLPSTLFRFVLLFPYWLLFLFRMILWMLYSFLLNYFSIWYLSME